MKKKYLMIVMIAALLMAGCASSDDGLQTNVEQPTEVTPDDGKFPIGFTAYADRAVTRGGKVGGTNIDALKEAKADGGGFGVFAYYTDLKKYDQTYVPNFMYNQGVFWKGADGTGAEEWLYSPVMYWPNESGTDAQSDDEDKVTFFAYAPFVETTSVAAGSVEDATYGITGFSRNTNQGDPLVKYIANFNTANTVDLCWGVCSEPSWPKIQGGTTQSMTAGLPWLDVERPQTTAQRMKFTFKHALAQLNVQIDADVDKTDHASNDVLDANTKIYVRSVSFTGIALKGALNLNNTVANQALWLDYSGTTDLPYGESVTVKDGRRDGREGTVGAEATNETAGINPELVQSTAWGATGEKPGVTVGYQNLFSPSTPFADPESPTAVELSARLAEPVYVIPTGEAMTVTIVYDVETANPDLSSYLSDGVTHGSSVENKITKTIYLAGSPMSLESGKKYTLTLHLGMNSMKFDAAVDSWDNTVVNANSWLPENVSAVRILNNSNQITHATMSTSDADLTLTGDVRPSGVAQALTWTSSNPAVASIANTNVGTIHPEADGECTITATSKATGKSASIKLLVTHKYSDVVPGDVGKIIAANGYIYTNTTQAKEYGTNGVGLICYAGDAGTADYSAGATSYKALALALTDANGGATCQWYTSSGTCLTQQTDISVIYGAPATYRNGIANTATMTTGACNTAGHTHDAATAASTYNDVSFDASFTAHSAWFLPSIEQWDLMIRTLAPTDSEDHYAEGQSSGGWKNGGTDKHIPRWEYVNDDYTAAALNPKITASGATGLQSGNYWSSTEDSASYAWDVTFNYGAVLRGGKTRPRWVRAAFAF